MEVVAMKLATVLFALVGPVLFASQVAAETWSQRLTPKKTDNSIAPGDSFTIRVQRLKGGQDGELLQVHVTVKLPDDKHLPLREGVLQVYNGKEFVSYCQLQPTGHEGDRSFSFRISAKYAEKSTFTYAQHAIAFDSIAFWFYIQDFVESK
jgi:hypothetical protein